MFMFKLFSCSKENVLQSNAENSILKLGFLEKHPFLQVLHCARSCANSARSWVLEAVASEEKQSVLHDRVTLCTIVGLVHDRGLLVHDRGSLKAGFLDVLILSCGVTSLTLNSSKVF